MYKFSYEIKFIKAIRFHVYRNMQRRFYEEALRSSAGPAEGLGRRSADSRLTAGLKTNNHLDPLDGLQI